MPQTLYVLPSPSLSAIFAAAVLAASLAAAQETVKWKTGAALRQQLDQPEGFSWQERPLREGLMRLSQAYGVAIFLDRRIDPGRLVTLTVRNQPVEDLFRQIAVSAEAELSALGPVLYLGPPQTASQLASLAALRKQDVAKLSSDARARLMRTQAWQWPELAQPRQLLSELARQAALEVENPELIPHDLWPAASLPALPWVDRLTLLLAGFGLTYELPGRGDSIRLVPMPADVQNTAPPAAKNTVPPGRITKGGGQKVYTMKFENQAAGNVVKSVANLIGKELKFDPALLERLKQPVTLDLKDAPLNELLDATLKPLGLTHRMTASALEVTELK